MACKRSKRPAEKPSTKASIPRRWSSTSSPAAVTTHPPSLLSTPATLRLTECTAALINPFDARRKGSCGKPLPNWDVRIVDDNDCEVTPGTLGEIVTRPRNPWLGTSGYYGKPEATVELFRNFWIHTGDMGRMDEDGYFYFVDRPAAPGREYFLLRGRGGDQRHAAGDGNLRRGGACRNG